MWTVGPGWVPCARINSLIVNPTRAIWRGHQQWGRQGVSGGVGRGLQESLCFPLNFAVTLKRERPLKKEIGLGLGPAQGRGSSCSCHLV